VITGSTTEFHHTLLEILAGVSKDTAEFISETNPRLFGGGPGSGCRGPNCGRPKGQRPPVKTYQTHEGYKYSIMRPSRRGIAKGSHSFLKTKDQLKGKYRGTVENVEHLDLHRTGKTKGSSSVYDAAWPKGDRYEAHGKTIIVHTDYAKMRLVVHEIPHDEMNHSAVVRTFKFKDFGDAAGFLDKRYGIKQKTSKVKE
jgi:hypothetical protein